MLDYVYIVSVLNISSSQLVIISFKPSILVWGRVSV